MMATWLESDGGVRDQMDDVPAYLDKLTVKDEGGLWGHKVPVY